MLSLFFFSIARARRAESIIAMASGLQRLSSVEQLKPGEFQSANLPSTGEFVIQAVLLVLDLVEGAELDLSIT
jgi:hypothetical protein